MNESKEDILNKIERLNVAIQRAKDLGDTRRASLLYMHTRLLAKKIDEKSEKQKTASVAKTKAFSKIVKVVSKSK